MDTQSSPLLQAHGLTQTKLLPPRLRADIVARRLLLAQIHDRVLSHPFTLICAPAGYGKTTLAVALHEAYPDPPTAWLTLDEEDNDPPRFLSALVAALQTLNPAVGTNTLGLLSNRSAPDFEPRRVMGAQINDILNCLPEPFVLVLDDLHTIVEPAICAALDYLLERLPPQMHVVATTRHDPPLALARLRARGALAEFRLRELRFNFDETSQFLNDKLQLALSRDDLNALQARAEGWAAGLRLLAGSLDRITSRADRAAFIHDLTLTQRYIFDFLAEEVLRRQEPDIRIFLLETSVLSELTPALCAAVTGRGDAQGVLEELYRRNLFLIQVGEASRAFRYHALFADFLCEQLKRQMPQRVAELHRRAADAQQTTAPARAIGHYLAAELWDAAAQMIEQASEDFVRRGWFGTLRGWIEALPAVKRGARPRLLYLLGLSALQRGDLDEASALLVTAQRGFELTGDQVGLGETLLELVSTASLQQDHARRAALAQQALALPLPVHGQVQLLMARVWELLHQGDLKQADAELAKALDITLNSRDVRAFNVIAPIFSMHLALLPNGTARLESYCRQILFIFSEGAGPLQGSAHAMLAYTLFLRGSLAEAALEVERAREISRQVGCFAMNESQMHYVSGLLMAARGDYAGAEHYWESVLPWIAQTPSLRFFKFAYLYVIGRMQWMQRKFEQASQTNARIALINDPKELPYVGQIRKVMQALVEISENRYTDAERTLHQALAIEERFRPSVGLGSARVLLAYLHLNCHREREAWSQFAPVLDELSQKGLPGLILLEFEIAIPLLQLAETHSAYKEFARRLLDTLAAAGESKPVPVPDTGETLTPREVEILKLVAGGASNQAIAQSLVISAHTVKVHMTNILAKLRVTSRTQAASRAHELHLV